MKPGGKPGGVGGLLRDKRVQIGVVAAVGLGLFALLRGGGGGDRVQQAAGIDTSPTDLYNALTDLGQSWQQDLRDVRDLLDQRPGTGTGSDPAQDTPRADPWDPRQPVKGGPHGPMLRAPRLPNRKEPGYPGNPYAPPAPAAKRPASPWSRAKSLG